MRVFGEPEFLSANSFLFFSLHMKFTKMKSSKYEPKEKSVKSTKLCHIHSIYRNKRKVFQLVQNECF